MTTPAPDRAPDEALADARAEVERLRREVMASDDRASRLAGWLDEEVKRAVHAEAALAAKERECEEAVTYIRCFGEELVNAGFPGGDRDQILANLRAAMAQADVPTDHILPASPKIGDCVVVDANVDDTIKHNPKQNWPLPKR